MLARWLNRKTREKVSLAVFDRLNQAARDPDLFDDGLLKDNPDGRFEAMALMSAVLFNRLSSPNPALTELSQDVFNRVFKTFDQALRVLGVGDLNVGKRIRKMAENYYGRMHSYRPALVNGSADELQLAVARNCFFSEIAKPNREAVIAAKALAFKDALARLSDEALLQGQVTQPLVVEPTS